MSTSRKIFLFLLLLSLTVSLFVVAVSAESTNEAVVIDNDGNETEYATFSAAVNAAASKGYTIKLLKDVTYNGTCNLQFATLDLNGFNYTRTAGSGNETKSTFASGTSGANYTITGEGVINTDCRMFELYSGAASGGLVNSLTVKGTGKGIVVNSSAGAKALGISNGYATFENVTFNLNGAPTEGLTDSVKSYFQIAAHTLGDEITTFKNCTINANNPDAYSVFAISSTQGISFKMEGCTINSVPTRIFYIGKSAADTSEYTMIDADNCVFNCIPEYTTGASDESSLVYNGQETTALQRIFNFNNCYIRAYRIFNLGGTGGAAAEGAKVTINLNDCDVHTSADNNSPGVIRGQQVYLNAKNCRFDTSANFSGSATNDSINLTNCRFTKKFSNSTIVGNSDGTKSWYYTLEDKEYPWVYIETGDANDVADATGFYNMNGLYWDSFTEFKVTETVDETEGTKTYSFATHTVSGHSSQCFGISEFYPRVGSIAYGSDNNENAYFKYTVTDPLAGTSVASTTGKVNYNSINSTYLGGKATVNPYFNFYDVTNNTWNFTNYGLFVFNIDIKSEGGVGIPSTTLTIQSRIDSASASDSKDAQRTASTFTIDSTTTLADGTSVSDGEWHHVQLVLDNANDKLYLYIDGNLINSGRAHWANATYVRGLLIGIAPGVDQTIGNNICFDNFSYTHFKNDADGVVGFETDSSGNAILPSIVDYRTAASLRDYPYPDAEDTVKLLGHYYPNLDLALDSVNYGITDSAAQLVALADTTLGSAANVNAETSLDLCGYNLNVNTADAISAAAALKIMNGTLTVDTLALDASGANITLEALTVNADNISVSAEGGKVYLTSGTYNGAFTAADGSLVISTGTVFSDDVNEYVTEAKNAAVLQENGTYKVEQVLYGASVTLSTNLNMNFAMYNVFPVKSGYVARITKSYADGRENTVVEIAADSWKLDSYGYLDASFTDISAKEMSDSINIEILDANGVVIAYHNGATVKANLESIYNEETDEKLRTLAIDMLNYGAAAQVYFGYNTENLANSGIDAASSTTVTESDIPTAPEATDAKEYIGTSLVLSDGIVLKMYFSVIAAETVTVSDGENTYTYSVTDYDNYCSVSIALNAVMLDKAITVTLADAEGNVIASATDTIRNYLARVGAAEEGTVYNAVLKYALSAKAYFEA